VRLDLGWMGERVLALALSAHAGRLVQDVPAELVVRDSTARPGGARTPSS
jgi:DNA-binding LacI/PurR family transcriptional regulator